MTAESARKREIEERERFLKQKTIAEARSIGRMKRLVRQAERKAGDGTVIGGTGQTVLKLRQSPLARLIDQKRIGGEEKRAAEEITAVFMAWSGALLLHPLSMEKRDRSHSHVEPVWFIDTEGRYKRWCDHWGPRAKLGDPTMSIVIDALIMERPLRAIETDLGIRNGKAALALINGLRDYAARAEKWVDHRTAAQWKAAASSLFRLRIIT